MGGIRLHFGNRIATVPLAGERNSAPRREGFFGSPYICRQFFCAGQIVHVRGTRIPCRFLGARNTIRRMSLPSAHKARPFYRAALQRLDEARFILDKGQRTNAAVYLVGYGVECILKALLISSLPASKHDQVIKAFRERGQGHSYDWLKHEYISAGGAPLPDTMQRAFVTVSS